MNTALYGIMLTKEQVDEFEKRVVDEVGRPVRHYYDIADTFRGIVDKPRLYARICSIIGTFNACKLAHIRSDENRSREFYARHAERLGLPPKKEWFVEL